MNKWVGASVHTSICCSINIDNVKCLPLPSSVEIRVCVCVCVCVCVVFSLPVVRCDNYYQRLAVGKKKGGKYSQVPDPSLSLTDKLSGMLEELHSSLTFSPLLGCLQIRSVFWHCALKQRMFTETVSLFLKVTTWSFLLLHDAEGFRGTSSQLKMIMHVQLIPIKGIWSFVCVNEQNVQPCYWNIATNVNVLHESMRSGLRFFSESLPGTLNNHCQMQGTAAKEPNINSASGCQNTRVVADFLVSQAGNGTFSCSIQSGQSALFHELSRANYLAQSFTFFFLQFLHRGVIFIFFLLEEVVW